MSPWIASLFVIAALALVGGGIRLVIAARKLQGVLMIVAAVVILANLAILMIPVHAQ